MTKENKVNKRDYVKCEKCGKTIKGKPQACDVCGGDMKFIEGQTFIRKYGPFIVTMIFIILIAFGIAYGTVWQQG